MLAEYSAPLKVLEADQKYCDLLEQDFKMLKESGQTGKIPPQWDALQDQMWRRNNELLLEIITPWLESNKGQWFFRVELEGMEDWPKWVTGKGLILT